MAGAYTIYGGLKAVVWSDLIQGGALLFGGALMLYLGLRLTGGGTLLEGGGVAGGGVLEGWAAFTRDNAPKLHTVLPWNDPDVPWLAVFIGGLWIPNLFYWGMNQFITQRTLGAKSLAEGQKGIFLACLFKLAIPFLIVMPGIMAFDLFGDSILALAGGNEDRAGEIAYPYLIRHVMPPYLRGIMLAALAGAVMSSFNSGLNSAATIFTVDLYGKYVRRDPAPQRQVLVGRVVTAAIVVLACLWAPVISRFEGVFRYIQEIWGFITPGIVAAFLVGLILRRTPALAAKCALLLSPVLYALSRIPGWVLRANYEWQETADGVWQVTHTATGQAADGFTALVFGYSTMAFLHHMGIIFLVLVALMLLITRVRPLATPVTYPQSSIDTTGHPLAYVYGLAIIAVTVALYIIFW